MAKREKKESRPDQDPNGRRNAIIDAAIRLLSKKGLAGFSARGVAGAGKLSKSAVHYYFHDMNELLDEAEAEIARRYFRRVKIAADARLDPIDRFWHAVDVYYQPFDDNLTMTSHWLEYWVDATRRGKSANVERIQGELTTLFALLLEPLGVDAPDRRARALTSYFIGALMRQMTNPIELAEHRKVIAALCAVPLPEAAAPAASAPARAQWRWEGADPARLLPATPGLKVEKSGGIATILFNRPGSANSLSEDMLAGLSAALSAVDAADDVRVVVLRGAGERVFASGSDINEILRAGPEAYARDLYAKSCAPQIAALRKPAIAAINGDCIGGGMILAAAADIRIAVRTAHFGVPVAALGLAFPVEAAERLVQLVGPGQASQLLYSGTRIDAEEAARIGLVEQVVDNADFDDAVMRCAETIGRMGPLSVRASKAAIRSALDRNLRSGAADLFRDAWSNPAAVRGLETARAARKR